MGVNKIEEIMQRLAEVLQGSNKSFGSIFVLISVFSQVVQKH